jgi:hypothetical protein
MFRDKLAPRKYSNAIAELAFRSIDAILDLIERDAIIQDFIKQQVKDGITEFLETDGKTRHETGKKNKKE